MTTRVQVLVIEDDLEVRQALGDLLADAGYTIATAVNGAEALAALRGGLRPDVILLDLWMPAMDGFQFRAEQRRDPEIAHIPIVLLTADRAIDRAAHELGASCAVAKPARVDELLAALDAAAEPTLAAADAALT